MRPALMESYPGQPVARRPEVRSLRVGLFTREYPPQVYGGAGVHVDYLSRELAKEIEVEVHCWGPQNSDEANLHVRGAEPWSEITEGTVGKFKGALEAMSLNLTQVKALEGIDVVHTHTWYVSMGTKADILRAYPGVDPERIHVIYNGVDLAEYQKTPDTDALVEFGVDPAVPYILFVGRITRQKGVTHLVDAIRHLPDDTQVVLCAGAPDTPEIAAEMRQMVDEAQRHHPRVIWIEKMVTKPQAIQLYSNCRVFCCPSVYEPFGIINLEAMACRAPVVASAVGGIKEVVVEGETGYLVPFDQDPATSFPTDPEKFARDLAARLNQMLQDPEKCRQFGDAGRKRVEDIFSWTAIAHQTIELYERLIERMKSSA